MYTDILIDGKDSPLSAFKKLAGDPIGYTVPRTARILGMSKQAVDQAIRKGALSATRIYMQTPKGKTLISCEVERDSVHAYLHAREGRQRVPQGFLATQAELPLS